MNEIDNSQMPPENEQASMQPAEDTSTDAGHETSAKAEAEAALEAVRTENGELRDKLLRSIADMENLRRRTEKEKTDIARYAISEFARDVIGIGDNIRRAIEAVPKDTLATDPALKNLADGIEVTERELFKVLERHGIQRFDPKGEKFDPHVHDAMMRMETSEVPPETVYQVLHAGYMIGDRVLRPAAVIVAKAGANADAVNNGGSPPPDQPVQGQPMAEAAPQPGPVEMTAFYAEDAEAQPEAGEAGPQVVRLNRGPRTEKTDNGASQRAQILRQVNAPPGAPAAKRQSTMTRPVINRTQQQPKLPENEPPPNPSFEEN